MQSAIAIQEHQEVTESSDDWEYNHTGTTDCNCCRCESMFLDLMQDAPVIIDWETNESFANNWE